MTAHVFDILLVAIYETYVVAFHDYRVMKSMDMSGFRLHTLQFIADIAHL